MVLTVAIVVATCLMMRSPLPRYELPQEYYDDVLGIGRPDSPFLRVPYSPMHIKRKSISSLAYEFAAEKKTGM